MPPPARGVGPLADPPAPPTDPSPAPATGHGMRRALYRRAARHRQSGGGNAGRRVVAAGRWLSLSGARGRSVAATPPRLDPEPPPLPVGTERRRTSPAARRRRHH